MLEHGVENNRQLAHASCEGQLLRLTSGQQPLVEVPYDRIEAAGCQRPHVQGGTNPGASAPDRAFAPQGATVPVEGSHSHQGGDLSTVQCTQFRQVCQKGAGELFSHAGNGASVSQAVPRSSWQNGPTENGRSGLADQERARTCRRRFYHGSTIPRLISVEPARLSRCSRSARVGTNWD